MNLPAPIWITVAEFGGLASISRQMAHRSCVAGNWRGHHLIVRQVTGRGGAAGRRYEVLLASCPPDIQAAYAEHFGRAGNITLPAPIDTAGAPLPFIASNPQKEARDDKRAEWLESLIEPIAALPKGSAARAAAIKALIARSHVNTDGKRETFSRQKAYEMLRRYEAIGRAGLYRRERNDKGRRKTIVSKRFDALIRSCGHDDAYLEALRLRIQNGIRSEWRSGAGSWPNVAHCMVADLMEMAREAGCTLPDATIRASCRLPKEVIRAERRYRLPHMRRHDRRTYDAIAEPRVPRDRSLLYPLEWVAIDVYHVDCYVQREDGSLATPKGVMLADLGNNRVWVDLYLLEPGEGISQWHTVESVTKFCSTEGVFSHLYGDRGAENGWLPLTNDLAKLAQLVQARHRDVLRDGVSALPLSALDLDAAAAEAVHRSLPYRPQSKVIEALIAAVKRAVETQLPGYIGGERMKTKVAHHGKVPVFPGTFEEFVRLHQKGIDFYNSKPQQSGQFKGRSPNDVFQDYCKAHPEWRPVTLDTREIDIVFAKPHTLKIYGGGVLRHDGRRFVCPALASLVGEKAHVRQPLRDSDMLYVWDERKSYVGVALPETAGDFRDKRGAGEQRHRSKLLAQDIRKMEGETEFRPRDVAMERAVKAAGVPVKVAPSASIRTVFADAARDAPTGGQRGCKSSRLEANVINKAQAQLLSEMRQQDESRGKVA